MAEPSPGVEEKEQWTQRLERLQEAVAQLEFDRSKLQHHNTQLRTALEQVRNVCFPSGAQGFLCLFLKQF